MDRRAGVTVCANDAAVAVGLGKGEPRGCLGTCAHWPSFTRSSSETSTPGRVRRRVADRPSFHRCGYVCSRSRVVTPPPYRESARGATKTAVLLRRKTMTRKGIETTHCISTTHGLPFKIKLDRHRPSDRGYIFLLLLLLSKTPPNSYPPFARRGVVE